ncbi:Polyadenylate-binding protein-interacting protein 12 [Zea mays]|uniref:Polyadenylate-binding protein-interacting protein 12 n=1 Tax=Zea mays TaxID=4577 RepID=A0A3L6DMC6_MAIZE|nr:Polyadenylate-binding protein-interacting protein 12 [Zea mays]
MAQGSCLFLVTQADLKLFFESICGEVFRLRLLGDYHHSTRIAFVEFVMRYVFSDLKMIRIRCLRFEWIKFGWSVPPSEETNPDGKRHLLLNISGGKCYRCPKLQWRDTGILANKGEPLEDSRASPCASPADALKVS